MSKRGFFGPVELVRIGERKERVLTYADVRFPLLFHPSLPSSDLGRRVGGGGDGTRRDRDPKRKRPRDVRGLFVPTVWTVSTGRLVRDGE